MSELQIMAVREHPEWLERAIDYFDAKWPYMGRMVYQDCITHSLTTESPLPRWYLMIRGENIVGSYGLIMNDFISRQDLWPWLVALYVEESERGQALGAQMLSHGRQEALKLGFSHVYLCTNHVGFYEKYGWKHIGHGYGIGYDARIYEI